MKKHILIVFFTFAQVTVAMEHAPQKAALLVQNAPSNCFEIKASHLLDSQKYSPESHLEKALNIYSSLQKASQTTHSQTNAIGAVLGALKLVINRASPSLETYNPKITFYRQETDLNRSRTTANTAAWLALGKLVCADKIRQSSADSVRQMINDMERVYLGLESNAELKRKHEQNLAALKQFKKQKQEAKKMAVPGQAQITSFFNKP